MRSARQMYKEAAAVGHDVAMPDAPIDDYDFGRYMIDFLQHQRFYADICARHHHDLLGLGVHRFLVQEAAADAFDDAQLGVMLDASTTAPEKNDEKPRADPPTVSEPTLSDGPLAGFWTRFLKLFRGGHA